MSRHDLAELHRRLTRVHNAMTAVALLLMATFVGLWTGVTPEALCAPLGGAALLATGAAIATAARTIGREADDGPLAHWNGTIRTMGLIDAVISVALIAYPSVG